ncbi:hypothetical protein NWI01_33120 [Nitrobacter winogradskyi]|uniref:Uncharacterized protein n=1 Tax=Nitrobacter winogradskyi TaxID=913 RepID=A0A4Y3WH35_NITWI|nr:hypothetical protein NWI01_33120 [Nitrobacter winogradskyi]
MIGARLSDLLIPDHRVLPADLAVKKPAFHGGGLSKYTADESLLTALLRGVDKRRRARTWDAQAIFRKSVAKGASPRDINPELTFKVVDGVVLDDGNADLDGGGDLVGNFFPTLTSNGRNRRPV